MQRVVYLPVSEAAYTVVADQVFSHVTSLSLHWHVSKRTGAVMRALDRGLNSAGTIINQLFLRLVPTVAELIVMCVMAATTFNAPGPAAILFSGFVVYWALTVRITSWRRKVQARMLRQDNTASQIAADALSNAEAVKVFANETWEQQRYANAIAAYQRSMNRSNESLTTLNILQQVVTYVTMGGVLLIAASDVASGRASVGRFVFLNTMTAQTFAPLGFLGTIWGMLNQAFADLANLLALLKQPQDMQDKPGAVVLRLKWHPERTSPAAAPTPKELSERDGEAGPIEAEHVLLAVTTARTAAAAEAHSVREDDTEYPASIEFRDVWFSYGTDRAGKKLARSEEEEDLQVPSAAAPAAAASVPPSEGEEAVARKRLGAGKKSGSEEEGSTEMVEETGRWVLKGVNFRLEAGKSLAIVGPSGAGKSSIAKLLFRLYDVQRGAVVVGDHNVRDVTKRSLRSQMGMVSQDTSLFNASLRYNIRYGSPMDPSIQEKDVEDAARRAALGPLMESLAEGLDTVVGERGLQLSGGERQRVAIARTLLRDPPILVADEYSSALDSVTEAEVSKTMTAAARGRTLIVIAHRLSTAMHCDQIIVLKDGKVVEAGTHKELLSSKGVYADLWTLQAKEAAGEGRAEVSTPTLA
jgi:ABC-type transport system involved in Fe-S cluster assembly fused permease/ATPase subunit